MSNQKHYWKGIEELANDPFVVKNAEKEFAEHLPIQDAYGDNTGGTGTSRRDFLKMMGFSVAAVSLAACETPIKKAIPYLNKPESVDPGIPNYYASTYIDGSEYCPVVVKTREGRPIFIEGNNLSSLTKGAVSARAQASILMLYDNEKAKNPTKGGQAISWENLDKEVIEQLQSVAASGAAIRIVSNTIVSPSTKLAIAKFVEKYPTAKLVQYDAESASGIIEAARLTQGKAVVPSYHFGKAQVIVSVGADFLGTWVNPTEFAAQYAATRKVNKDKREMSKHFQFEALMSLAGANADYRTAIKPSQEGLVIAALYNKIAAATGKSTLSIEGVEAKNLDKAAEALLAAKGASIVVAGSNDANVQALVNGINDMLENTGKTVDFISPLYVRQGSDKEMNAFVAELAAGQVGAVIFYNANPVYDYAKGAELAAAIKNAKLSVATADRLHETASLCQYNAPDSHFLESWNDAEGKRGYFSLCQPTIGRIFDTRQVQQSLLLWAGNGTEYGDLVRSYWKENLFGLQNIETEFERFWQRSLHDGVFEPALSESFKSVHEVAAVAPSVDWSAAAGAISSTYSPNNADVELVIYSSLLGNGAQANNPVLQEVPDPISKVCWGNYLTVPQSMAKAFGFKKFETKVSVAKVTIGSKSYELPVVIQPGQAANVVGIKLGYGRGEKAGQVAMQATGADMFPHLNATGDFVTNTIFKGVKVEDAGRMEDIAQTQTHETFMGRETIIQETTLDAYKQDVQAGRYKPMIATSKGLEKPGNISLWDIKADGYSEKKAEEPADKKALLWFDRVGLKADQHTYNNHHWGMTIDLNTCTGCSACVVACSIENNVPVVGKQEIINRREMHWIRIDRYYSSDAAPGDNEGLEMAAENPQVVFQPMMCQHCNNAPCETVCPVAATTHSSEGLNQMTYNRCIGTKYCANNCPYKVRRFNWFKYNENDEFNYYMNNDLGKMVLNPDVTVRSRGVMEKCSLCVQRIQAGKLKAKREGRQINDGEVKTACASACPTQAITFGDLNNPNTAIRTQMEDELDGRAYHVLEEINVNPNVWYLRKVRNVSSQA